MMRLAALSFGLLLLAACASAPHAPRLAANDYRGADDVETAARLLAAAADAQGEWRAEALSLMRLMGIRAAEGEADLVGQWAAALPDDRVPPMRGRLLGPAYRSGILAPGARVATGQLFEGGRAARVSLSGVGGPSLMLTIADDEARQVCQTDPGSPRNCRWVPVFAGRYAITVENAGKRPARYFLVIG